MIPPRKPVLVAPGRPVLVAFEALVVALGSMMFELGPVFGAVFELAESLDRDPRWRTTSQPSLARRTPGKPMLEAFEALLVVLGPLAFEEGPINAALAELAESLDVAGALLGRKSPRAAAEVSQ